MSDTVLHPEFFDLVGNVRAMRRLKPDPVPEELIMKVLNAGVMAASGQNLQPWEFYWVKDKYKKQELVEACFSQSAARTAQELVVGLFSSAYPRPPTTQ